MINIIIFVYPISYLPTSLLHENFSPVSNSMPRHATVSSNTTNPNSNNAFKLFICDATMPHNRFHATLYSLHILPKLSCFSYAIPYIRPTNTTNKCSQHVNCLCRHAPSGSTSRYIRQMFFVNPYCFPRASFDVWFGMYNEFIMIYYDFSM